MKVTIFKAENTRYLVGISGAPAQETRGGEYLGGNGETRRYIETSIHLERSDLESLILQLTGHLAKLDQDAETTKVVGK